MNPVDRLLPASLSAQDVAYRIGLVSDTHTPSRLAQLPPALMDALHGVDLILHAGDVGELWVLDQLSTVAPVVAVHGNDESPSAAEILPYTELVALQGKRILLWHSHYPDWAEELAARQGDAIEPKLRHIAMRGREFDARIVVFGHWHFPLVYQWKEVTLINPGALASPNVITRQLHQTAAVLFLDRAGNFYPVHFNLAAPERAYDPHFDIQAGFAAADRQYTATILAEDLLPPVLTLRTALSREEVLLVGEAILPLAHSVWRGDATDIQLDEFVTTIAQTKQLPTALKTRVLEIINSV